MAYNGRKQFRLTNVNTGQVIEGTADELIQRIGLQHRYTLYQSKYTDKPINGEWKIEQDPKGYSPMDPVLAAEWDKAVRRIKNAPKRRKTCKNRVSSSTVMFSRI